MKVWQCVTRFFASPWDMYVPVGAIVYEYENVEKLAVAPFPFADSPGIPDSSGTYRASKNPVNVKGQYWEFNDISEVTWFTAIVKEKFFILIRDLVEKHEGGAQAGTTLYIVAQDGAPYKTIEDAVIDASNDGVPEPLVFIRPGEYVVNNPILLNNPISIKGSGAGTIVTVNTPAPEAFLLNGNDISISDLVIDGTCNADVGVYFYGANRCSVWNCHIKSTLGSSVIMDGVSQYCAVEQNTFRQFVGYALREISGDFNRVSNNTIIRV